MFHCFTNLLNHYVDNNSSIFGTFKFYYNNKSVTVKKV